MQYLHQLELRAYDHFLVWHARQSPIDSRIVLIGINEHDFKQWGWPLSDNQLAQLLQQLIALHPKVIGLDLYRDSPIPRSSEQNIYPDFELLNRLFANQHNLVGIENYSGLSASRIGSPPGLANTNRIGFNDVLRDQDGTVRRGFLYLQDNKKIHFSFPYLLASQFTGTAMKRDTRNVTAIRLNRGRIVPFYKTDGAYVDADDQGFQFWLDYQGGHQPFPTYSMTDVLLKKIPADSIKDKIVIVGITAKSAKDIFLSPFHLLENQRQDLSGIALLGHITSQLVRISSGETQQLKTINELVEGICIWIASIIGTFSAFKFRQPVVLVTILTCELLALYILSRISFVYYWWFPLIPCALAWALSKVSVLVYLSTQERREKQFLQQIYSPYLPQNVADVLWQTRETLLEGNRLRPHHLVATVLFSDICDFSSVAERLQPEDLLKWLNLYMQTMLKTVTKHNGMVNKMMGDGIMAVFGAPVKRTNDAQTSYDAINAANCALEMGKALEAINQRYSQQDFPQIKIRIGIMTGSLVAGSVGDNNRLEYTVLGDVVNIAARLESYDKTRHNKHASRILIGESTMLHLTPRFTTEYVGKITLKGKSVQVGVYHLTN